MGERESDSDIDSQRNAAREREGERERERERERGARETEGNEKTDFSAKSFHSIFSATVDILISCVSSTMCVYVCIE